MYPNIEIGQGISTRITQAEFTFTTLAEALFKKLVYLNTSTARSYIVAITEGYFYGRSNTPTARRYPQNITKLEIVVGALAIQEEDPLIVAITQEDVRFNYSRTLNHQIIANQPEWGGKIKARIGEIGETEELLARKLNGFRTLRETKDYINKVCEGQLWGSEKPGAIFNPTNRKKLASLLYELDFSESHHLLILIARLDPKFQGCFNRVAQGF